MDLKYTKARAYDIKVAENRKHTVQANLSTYEGKLPGGQPKYSSWRAAFVGDAFERAKALSQGEKIVIRKGKVDNTYDKEKEKQYVNVTVFAFETEEDRR